MADIFTKKAPAIMALLIQDFNLTELDAAAIVGNLGHESRGFKLLQEIKPLIPGSAGGYGWAQWTGPRRRTFEAYCARNRFEPHSDKANYGFLFVELKGSESAAIPAVKEAIGLEAKVKAFELNFERAHPAYKHYPSRVTWANRALAAYRAGPIKPLIPDAAPPTRKPQTSWLSALINAILSIFRR